MKHIRTVIVLFLAIFILSANTKQNTLRDNPGIPGPLVFDKQLLESMTKNNNESFIFGFGADPKFNSSRLQLVYFSKSSEAFTGKVLLSNFTSKDKNYELICLIDYKQTNFKLDTTWSKNHSVTLTSKKHREISIEVAALTPGIHDFMIVAVRKDVDNTASYVSRDDYNIFSHRANIFVDQGGFPNVAFKTMSENIKNKSRSISIALNYDKNITNFSEPKVSKLPVSGKQNYFIHVSNHHNKNNPYSLLVFANGTQVSFKVEQQDKSDIYYYSQKQKTINTIPISFDSKNDKIESLWAISVINPYSLLETEYGKIAEIPTKVRITNILSNQ